MVSNVRCFSSLLQKWLFLLVLFVVIRKDLAAYVPPIPSVEPLFPKGLRMSIPDEDGISLVAYHVKINEDFDSLEAGTIARDIIKTRNGRWTYMDRTTRLKRGDVLYYWIHVVYDGLGYNLLDKSYTVNDFYNEDGSLATGTTKPIEKPCPVSSVTQITETNGQRRSACSGQVLFEDNFDNLNVSRWTVLERFSEGPDYEFVVYMNSNDIVETKNGNLHIKPVLVDEKYGTGFVRNGSLSLSRCTGNLKSRDCEREGYGSYILPPIISGRLNTKGTFNFLYGRIQVRAKLPRGDWTYPLISLESIDRQTQTTATQREIRIAFARGNIALRSPEGVDLGACVLSAGALTITQNQSQVQDSNRMSLPTKVSATTPWSDDYHVYEIEWRQGRIILRVDDVQYGEQAVSSAFDTPVYINLGLAVGGRGEFPDKSRSGTFSKPWRNIESKALFNFYLARDNWLQTWRDHDTGLHIDYVKVWAL